MNKVIKGTVAAAAAVALFGSGAGSLAYWQDSESTDAMTLQMGHLLLDSGAKTYSLNGEAMTYDTLIGYSNRLVPGDVVTYQHNFGIDVALGADAVLRVAALDFGNTSSSVMDAIDAELTVSTVEEWSDGLSYAPTNEARAFNVTGRGMVEVKISISVPADLEDPESMVNGIFLEPVPVTLTQVAEPLPPAEG
ncbi:alternate-type signal peptide domain-containing protein [Nocardioides gilvus]|uniref:alternate-type signal peptide domain-containing protein n=1 Tax=Nocardioides gilvus TaxID=1735589 RepID=UPI000D74665B|nr:alternate-type signal peptide domain-containing protein [Nocardioides gilvus]